MITAVVRDRWQLTIPDQIREFLEWLKPGEVVGLEVEDEEIRIRPYSRLKQEKVDWDNFWNKVQLARSFKGKRGNLSAMVVKDRGSH